MIKMLINRDYSLTEEIDFNKNILPLTTWNDNIKRDYEAVPIYYDGVVVGWQMQGRYE